MKRKGLFMNKRSLIFGLALLSQPLFADCQKLTIACTYNCGPVSKRLKISAARLGQKVDVIQLKSLGSIEASLAQVDAVIVPGGADIDPKFYMDDVTPELATYTQNNLRLVKFTEEGKVRDGYEHQVVKTYIENEKYSRLPLLGICRGMQMMSVAQGLPLYLDIATELNIPNRIGVKDDIKITEANSLMHELYQDMDFKGKEFHHQGLRVDYYHQNINQYPQVLVSAYSNKQKIAESIEYKERPALGIQYHPESSTPRVEFPIFKWLLNKACIYQSSRKENL